MVVNLPQDANVRVIKANLFEGFLDRGGEEKGHLTAAGDATFEDVDVVDATLVVDD